MAFANVTFSKCAAAVMVCGLGCVTSLPATARPQPYMQQALDRLQNARDLLRNADADKGGHRVNAMNLIDQAMREVRAGIQYSNRRGR